MQSYLNNFQVLFPPFSLVPVGHDAVTVVMHRAQVLIYADLKQNMYVLLSFFLVCFKRNNNTMSKERAACLYTILVFLSVTNVDLSGARRLETEDR